LGKLKKGKLIVFSAPSGAGKTTLVKYLMGKIPALSFSVSAASRNARKGEVNGKDYHFLTVDEFRKNINQDAFVEWEEVYKDHFYGTLSSEVERIRNQGQHVVFDVDVKGGVNIKKIFGEDVLAVFIEPPSIDALKLRLENRATDSKKDIQTRIEKAKEELDFAPFFDVIIVNDDLDIAKKEVFEKVSEFIDG